MVDEYDTDDHVRIGPLSVPRSAVASLSQSRGTETTSENERDGSAILTPISESLVSLGGLEVTFSGEDAHLRAAELLELGGSVGQQPLPIGTPGQDFDTLSGFYTLDVDREVGLSARDSRNQSANIDRVRLSTADRAATIGDYHAAVLTNLNQPDPGHEFGNDTDALVGLPAAASAVRAVNRTLKPEERVVPDVVETRTTERGDVDLYDAAEYDFDPAFLYDIDYADARTVDPVVWDSVGTGAYGETYGESYGLGSKFGADKTRQWQAVFSPAHDFNGVAIFDNGLLRLYLSDSGLSVREYDADADEWDAVDLPSSDWQLVDADIRAITPPRVEAQLEFADDDGGDLYAVDIALDRGRDDLQVWIPESVSDPIPSGLEELFEPIASESVVDPGVRQSLVSREEVRR